MKQRIAWEITDEFWETVKDLLIRKGRDEKKEYKRKPGGGRKPKDFRAVLPAIFYVLRTGVQWKALPEESGSSSAVHRYVQLWSEQGVFLRMWQRGLERYDELKGIQWEWQSIDGSMVKASLAQEEGGPNLTDREKNGSKRHVLVDGAGVPLTMVLTGSNVPDVKRVSEVLDGIVIERPERAGAPWENLCAGKGRFGEPAFETTVLRGYIPHVVPRGEEKKRLEEGSGKRARRWVGGRMFSRLNRFRKLLVRYEKKAVNYRGLLMFACTFICFRQIESI